MIQTNISIPKLKLSASNQSLLRCPICHSPIKLDNQIVCTNTECASVFPVINEIPVLLNEADSVFSISDFTDGEGTNLKPKPKLERLLINLTPKIVLNLNAKKNYQKFVEILLQQNQNPKVLIVGGSVLGEGMEPLLSNSAIELIETDVAFSAHTSVVCDLHDLPFADNSFDGVVVQAVLEHVVNPTRCVEEIHRVLKPNGLVYAETPFMQQVHLGRYDFTRFTHLGHRYLFCKFKELDSGAVCGPGMALAWSYQYFLLSFVKSSGARALVKFFARLTSFWLKYFDYYLINKPGTFDAASGYYFLGMKSQDMLSAKELITLYQGAQASSF